METKKLSTKKEILVIINAALKNNGRLKITTMMEDIGIFKHYDKENFSFRGELWSRKKVYNMCVRNPYIFLTIV